MGGLFDHLTFHGLDKGHVNGVKDHDHGAQVGLEGEVTEHQLTLIDGQKAKDAIVLPIAQLKFEESLGLTGVHVGCHVVQSVQMAA